MKLILTEEEQFLKDTAKNFAEERCPITHFRSLRDNNDPNLWDKEIWKEVKKIKMFDIENHDYNFSFITYDKFN